MYRKMRKLIKAKCHIPVILICLVLFFLTISYGKSAGLNQTVIKALSFVFFIIIFILSGINVFNSYKRVWSHIFGQQNNDKSKETEEK